MKLRTCLAAPALILVEAFDHYIPHRWHRLVARKLGGRMELYIDGVPAPPISSHSAAAGACRFLLGWGYRPFVGRIDELALDDRPLSAEEIRRHYEPGARREGRPDRESPFIISGEPRETFRRVPSLIVSLPFVLSRISEGAVPCAVAVSR
jgi:hypothetical protein